MSTDIANLPAPGNKITQKHLPAGCSLRLLPLSHSSRKPAPVLQRPGRSREYRHLVKSQSMLRVHLAIVAVWACIHLIILGRIIFVHVNDSKKTVTCLVGVT